MAEHDIPDLTISDEKLCFVISEAREFDVKDVVTNPDDASNPTDDAMIRVLEDHEDDPVVQELVAVINSMSVDEQVDLVALTWLGRGDGTIEDWSELRAEAARALTTGARLPTCLVFLYWRTISARLLRNSASSAKARSRFAAWRCMIGVAPSAKSALQC
jgi:hypothetical protein